MGRGFPGRSAAKLPNGGKARGPWRHGMRRRKSRCLRPRRRGVLPRSAVGRSEMARRHFARRGDPLRDADIESRILLMTGFWRGEETEIVRLRLTPTVWEPWHIESLETPPRAERAPRRALEGGHWHGPAGRIARRTSRRAEGHECRTALGSRRPLTHLASSEIMDAPSVAEQSRRFEEAQRMVRPPDSIRSWCTWQTPAL